jgi:hypothetical protein
MHGHAVREDSRRVIDRESQWAMRCIVTALISDFRPDAVVLDVLNDSSITAEVSARRTLIHMRASAAEATALTDRLRRWSDAIVVLRFDEPPTAMVPPVPNALVARPAIRAPRAHDASHCTRYIAVGHAARAAIIRLQQIALVTVTRGGP